jgi:hypothetical protein
MAERIVCNASPLIFLAKLDKLALLDVYELHVPSQVEPKSSRAPSAKNQTLQGSPITFRPGTSSLKRSFC